MQTHTTYPYHESAERRTDIFGWTCRNCYRYHGDSPQSERMARFCCTHQGVCAAEGCEQVSEPNRTLCAEHLAASETARERKRFESAEKVPASEWHDRVYCEGFGEEFFDGVDEFLEAWKDEHAGVDDDNREFLAEPVPPYVYAARLEPFIVVNADTLYEGISENAYDEWDGEIKGRKELEAALEAFNQANDDEKLFVADYSKAIVLERANP